MYAPPGLKPLSEQQVDEGVVFCHFFAPDAALYPAQFMKSHQQQQQQTGKGPSSSSSSSSGSGSQTVVGLFQRVGYVASSEAVQHWFETDHEHRMAQVQTTTTKTMMATTRGRGEGQAGVCECDGIGTENARRLRKS
jgi:hypothetical protein